MKSEQGLDPELMAELEAWAADFERKNQAQKKFIQDFVAGSLVRTDLSEADYLASEIFKLSLADPRTADDPQRSPFLSIREYTRKLGEKLNELGGFSLMREIAEMVPRYDQGELNLVWDRIGEWMA